MPGPVKNTSSLAAAQPMWDISRPVSDLGGLYISDTAEHPGDFLGFLATTAAVADITGGSIGGTVTAVAIPAGTFLPFRGPRIKLASGTGIAYYATPQ